MISALLLAVVVLAPGQQTATVPTGIRPPVSVGTTNPSCGVIALRIDSPERIALEGGGELGNQPPFMSGSTIRLHRNPGTTITWSVLYFDDHKVAASGEVVVPPCISAPLPPRPHVVVDDTVDIGTPLVIVRSHRGDVFDRWTQLIVRGAW